MYSGLFPLLFTPNFISILIWFIVIIFLVPHRPLFGLYLWLFLAFWTLFYFPISRPYVDRGIADDFGEAIIYLIAFPIAISILVWILFIVANVLKSDRHIKEQEKLPELISLNKIVLFIYGILLGMWAFLFFTDFLQRYHPAWEAYTIVTLFSFSLPLLLALLSKNIRVRKYIHKQQIHWFIGSFWLAIISLIFYSFSFASIAMIQTKKTLERYANLDAKYCIQYIKIDTWLDLTPLTTWNKAFGIRGAVKNHAILVVKTPNSPAHLYNWSYKYKTWKYITKGFKPDAFASPSDLECTLEKDFIARVPFIIPQTNSFYVGERKIKILPKYFPKQEDYSFANIVSDRERRKEIKIVEFLALAPDFNSIRQIFPKLSDEFNIWRKVHVSPLLDQNDLEIIFNIRNLAKFEQANLQYNLEKKVFTETAKYLDSAKRRLYYQKKNGFIKTVIECTSNSQTKFSCRHYFIHDNFIFYFNHREKDLKNWRLMQTNLINKIEY